MPASQRIIANSAVDFIAAVVAGIAESQAIQAVIPCAASQRVRALAASQRVVVAAADQAVRSRSAAQIVVPRPAKQRVVAIVNPGLTGRGIPSLKPVIAHPAFNEVVFVIALEDVAAIRAGQILNACKHIAPGIPAGCCSRMKIHGHRGAGPGIRGRVVAAAAVNEVAARAAFNHVVAVIAHQRVVIPRPDQVLNPRQRVAGRIASSLNGLVAEVHVHGGI